MKTIVYACVGIPLEIDDKYAPLAMDWFKNFPNKKYDDLLDDLDEKTSDTIKPMVEKVGWKFDEVMCVKCDDVSGNYVLSK